MRTVLRRILGVVGALVAMAAVLPLMVGGFCAYANITSPPTPARRGRELLWVNPGLDGLWGSVPVMVVSLLVIGLGVWCCLWGFRRRNTGGRGKA
ncbi:MAG TPA: hypothetical protein VK196_20205 [Magnetospirillum sp.]|nr:hypothetical protein [Magnetospirillum sp.]